LAGREKICCILDVSCSEKSAHFVSFDELNVA
jgi:hypothetical protein